MKELAPTQADEDFSVPRTHQYVVTLTVHTNPRGEGFFVLISTDKNVQRTHRIVSGQDVTLQSLGASTRHGAPNYALN